MNILQNVVGHVPRRLVPEIMAKSFTMKLAKVKP